MKIGVLGDNYVGRAVEYGFNSPDNEILVVDYQHTSQLNEVEYYDVIFICIANTGDDSVLAICDYLVMFSGFMGLVVIKTPLSPGELEFDKWKGARASLPLALNPDLVTPDQPNREFVETPMIIVGTDSQTTLAAVKALYDRSNLTKRWYMEVSFNEALLMKLFIETFLATKVAVMGEFQELFSKFSNRDWKEFTDMMGYDKRVGRSHTIPVNHPTLKQSMNTVVRSALINQTYLPTLAGAITSLQINQK